jgi:hypothetical protein
MIFFSALRPFFLIVVNFWPTFFTQNKGFPTVNMLSAASIGTLAASIGTEV